MKIVADSNIPFASDAFSAIGDVEIVKSSDLTTGGLRDCDILVCRSTRKIDAALLDGTKVRFVATATIGTDHVDVAHLKERGIGFASAPVDANSVSEYVTSALLTLAGEMGNRLRDMSIGVIGVGNVGRLVAGKAEALGMRTILNDPPLAQATGDPRYRPLDELFDADIITLHVPLTKEGPHATFHMCDDVFFGRMKPRSIFINAARGAVVDSDALHDVIVTGKIPAAALDTWENEPLIDIDLLGKIAVGTPHIAGHSFDGKVNGTKMCCDAVCEFLGIAKTWDPEPLMPPPDIPRLIVNAAGRDDEDVLREVVLAVYDVLRDDEDLRQMPADESRGEFFNALRRHYWRRREFQNTAVSMDGASEELRQKIRGLGFRTGE